MSHIKYIRTLFASCCIFILLISFLFILGSKHIANSPHRWAYVFLNHKKELLKSINGKKVVVLAGSNALFGFRADIFEQITGLKTVNMAVQANLGIGFMTHYIKPFLHKGDIVILPLEYTVLSTNMLHDSIGVYVSYGSGLDYFYSLPMSLKLDYLRSLQKQDFIDSVQKAIRFNKKYDPLITHLKYLNANGDFIFNPPSESTKKTLESQLAPYRNGQAGSTYQKSPNYISHDVLRQFLQWARQHGVIVVGTYPNIVNLAIDKNTMEQTKNWYKENNVLFVGNKKESVFPENMMLDTIYHLNLKGAQLRTRLFGNRFCKETDFCLKKQVNT